MRIAIISDIHGNYEALKAVLSDLERLRIHTVFCLGDLISYGPESDRCVQLIRELAYPTVMGNHELGLIKPDHLNWFNPWARDSLKNAIRTLSDTTRDYLSKLPPYRVELGYRFVHGFPPHSINTYLFSVDTDGMRDAFAAMEEPICFVGHTHLTELIEDSDESIQRIPLPRGVYALTETHRYIVNVGSVGQPRDGDRDAKYVILDTDALELEMRFVPYDRAAVVRKIRAAGLPEIHAQRLL